jgi:hypothetical protein
MVWLARLFIVLVAMILLARGGPDDEDQGDDGESR